MKTCEDAHQRIREMAVRGAPAIAIAGVLALAVELHTSGTAGGFASAGAAADAVSARLDYLVTRHASAPLTPSNARQLSRSTVLVAASVHSASRPYPSD